VKSETRWGKRTFGDFNQTCHKKASPLSKISARTSHSSKHFPEDAAYRKISQTILADCMLAADKTLRNFGKKLFMIEVNGVHPFVFVK